MLKNFTAAPHRVMFFGGALQTIAVMLWWMLELVTRYGIVGQPLSWPISASAAHAYLMLYGLFPFFMFGFLMTTFPRWMNGKEIPAKYYVPAFSLMLLGAFGFYLGLLVGNSVLVSATICLLAGWGMALYALLRVLLDTRPSDKRNPIILFIAFSMGWCGLASFLGWLILDAAMLLDFAIQCGLWFFLLPIFASVGHRMIPFFTGSALQVQNVPRPNWAWWTMLVASVSHGLLQLAEATNWLWLCDAALAFAALYLSYVWGLRRSLPNPLLAVLHVGFAWIGIAMLLFTAQSLLAFLNLGTMINWGFAPLHALTLGCFATLIIGFGTRVTLGHSGLPFKIDQPIKLMFVGIQLVALLRVLADMLPVQGGHWLAVVATAMWLASFVPWTLRFVPAYWQPRADGQPG